ncbi:Nucleotidylyl transferase [Trematosphaeria pertusa]|uniref:tryptophan--tRNA ligase n=1 Tax=Trematosphaeria pertusa TaxID=390896 RepID=A0A6A6I8X7_9PLEO|nr:Nucleotidylyl transferase [Trematosphaeria pertusa]KAF2246821.1 Nucleotidylyl transferase [Trematosphaeria pertusa]
MGSGGPAAAARPIDYENLSLHLGSLRVDNALMTRFKRVTGHEPHHLFRRGIIFSHRDFEVILDRYERREPFFIYAGRGPSSNAMHAGHVIAFQLAKWLSDVFEVPLLVMISDAEKFLRAPSDTKKSLEDYMEFGEENAKDIISVGCDWKRTFIYPVTKYMGEDMGFKWNWRKVSYVCLGHDQPLLSANGGQSTSAYHISVHCGFSLDDVNIGRLNFPAVIAAGAFASSFSTIFGKTYTSDTERELNSIPCLVAVALDEDPYMQFIRATAKRNNIAQPSVLHTKYLDGLQGVGSKMSASIDLSAIYVNDTPDEIRAKVGLQPSPSNQRPSVDLQTPNRDPERNVCYQYLKFFLEDDDELAQISHDYASGRLSSDGVKERCAQELIQICASIQERRERVTDQELEYFMTPRKLDSRV